MHFLDGDSTYLPEKKKYGYNYHELYTKKATDIVHDVIYQISIICFDTYTCLRVNLEMVYDK